MSFAPSVAVQCHQILEILHGSVLPGLHNGTAHILPSAAVEVESDSGFQDIFPYGTEWHHSFEWMWLSENPTHVKIRDAVYPMAPGDFCLIAPGVLHAEVYSPATLPHLSLWFAYRSASSTLHISLFAYDAVGHGQIIHSLVVRVASLTGTLLVALQSEIEGAQSRATEMCNSLVSLLANLIIRALETPVVVGPQGDALNGVSHQVINYLHDYYARDVSLDEIAHSVGLSRSYLATVFKQDTGKTVGQTLTEIRLYHAKLLLVEERRSVRDIAAAVGFGSAEHFSRVFKSYEKISPSLYGK